jgi:hypothetical protein
MNKLFYVYNHQNKADSYIRALRRAGWEETRNQREARFILSDMDISSRGRTIKDLHYGGVPTFLYPHGGIPSIFWDFPGYEWSRFVSAHFVPASGHIQVMRALGYPLPIEPVGWHLSPVRVFRPRLDFRRILFAPIHPNNNGFLSRIDREINAEAFKKARELAGSENSSLTVRYLGDLKGNGLWRAGGVSYLQGSPDLSTGEIERSDLVIAHHTFAYMAVAMGVPTLMMGEDYAPRIGSSEDKLERARSWEKYEELFKYPLDILKGDPFDLAVRAAGSDREFCEWRERMIGGAFDPKLFVSRLESYLHAS